MRVAIIGDEIYAIQDARIVNLNTLALHVLYILYAALFSAAGALFAANQLMKSKKMLA